MNKHLDKIIFHIDVNSAFLSWTAIKMLKEGYPVDIRTVPSIVGGDRESRHGIVLAKSVPAKKYGIVTAQTVASALNQCPDLLIVPAEHSYYQDQSRMFVELLKEYTPNIEQVSIDECYMDFTGIQEGFDSPIQAAHHIKDKVKNTLGFTVNVGISDVKVLAKMASDFTKPDKVHTLYKSEIEMKMWSLPVEDLFMAGHSSVDTLHKLGILNIGQLAKSPVEILEAHLKSHGRVLWEYANGIDDSLVNQSKEALKGVGNSTTLSRDYSNIEDINKVLLMLSEKVAGRLRSSNQKATTIAVEIKYNDFHKVSKQTTVESATDSGTVIYNQVKLLFKMIWTGQPVRLLGVRTANLVDTDEPEQLSLDDLFLEKNNPSKEKLKRLDKALDAIKDKYGENAVSRASLIHYKEHQKENTDK